MIQYIINYLILKIMAEKQKNKSILQRVMKKEDWLKLMFLIIFSVLCWTWVLVAYGSGFNY